MLFIVATPRSLEDKPRSPPVQDLSAVDLALRWRRSDDLCAT